jgi:hypothetical protein
MNKYERLDDIIDLFTISNLDKKLFSSYLEKEEGAGKGGNIKMSVLIDHN